MLPAHQTGDHCRNDIGMPMLFMKSIAMKDRRNGRGEEKGRKCEILSLEEQLSKTVLINSTFH